MEDFAAGSIARRQQSERVCGTLRFPALRTHVRLRRQQAGRASPQDRERQRRSLFAYGGQRVPRWPAQAPRRLVADSIDGIGSRSGVHGSGLAALAFVVALGLAVFLLKIAGQKGVVIRGCG
jgi:hypothetical protein